MKKDIDALKALADEIKTNTGIMQDFEKYAAKEYQENISKNTETDTEKIYNDRDQINKKYYKIGE